VRQREPTQAHRLDAFSELRRAEFAETPLGGFAGELITPRADPPPVPPQPLYIQPADWAAEARGREPDREHAPRLGPVDAMLAAEAPEPPAPVLDPPVVDQPLRRFEIPPVDWREVEAERDRERVEADRERRERQGFDTFPAGKAGRRAARATPNLDKARRIAEEVAEELGRGKQ
jgi:hypothetical protein